MCKLAQVLVKNAAYFLVGLFCEWFFIVLQHFLIFLNPKSMTSDSEEFLLQKEV